MSGGAGGRADSDGVSGVPDVEEAMLPFAQGEAVHIRRQLLDWYNAHRRHLPWRGDPPPYPVTKEQVARRGVGAAKAAGAKRDGKSKAGKRARVELRVEEGPTAAPATEPSGAVVASHVAPTPCTKGDGDGAALADAEAEAGANRLTVSAYGTWVSEIMCQQTRVDTVVRYWLKWMERFPTVEALAAATIDEVNELWAGLGYYRRARFLHQGAQKLVSEYGGKLPNTAEELLKIPGIGKYTAGAISSIANREPTPVVDGNVIRVVSRLRAINLDAKSPKLVAYCWAEAGRLVDEARPGDFNQSLMELGATVCVPKTPSCAKCPIQNTCAAYALAAGDKLGPAGVMTFPAKSAKKKARLEHVAVGVLIDKSDSIPQILLVKRPEKGLLANQWTFVVGLRPAADVAALDVTESKTVPKWPINERMKLVFDVAKRSLDFDITHGMSDDGGCVVDRGQATHLFSHIRHEIWVTRVPVSRADCAPLGDVSSPPEMKWVPLDQLEACGLTTWACKVLHVALDEKEAALAAAVLSSGRGKVTATKRKRPTSQPAISKFFGGSS